MFSNPFSRKDETRKPCTLWWHRKRTSSVPPQPSAAAPEFTEISRGRTLRTRLCARLHLRVTARCQLFKPFSLLRPRPSPSEWTADSIVLLFLSVRVVDTLQRGQKLFFFFLFGENFIRNNSPQSGAGQNKKNAAIYFLTDNFQREHASLCGCDFCLWGVG